MKNAYILQSESLHGRERLEDIQVDGGIILIQNFKNWFLRG
jgi:hypothetical protein